MPVPEIDLGNLVRYIIENKDVETTVDLTTDCTLHAEDQKPLIKIINYLLNYLNQLTNQPINVSLKKQSEGCLLCFIISTDHTEIPPIAENLEDVLKSYNGTMRVIFEEEKYAQILICFCEDHVPDSVVIEV